jgi:choline dehydrogenase-like flavoprotein
MAKNPKVDVCVIGTGHGGSPLTHVLVKNGVKVVALEAGPRQPHSSFTGDEWGQYLKLSWMDPGFTTSGKNIKYPWSARGVGGTSLHYAGVSWAFHEDDFKTKSVDGIGEDWPITYDELKPYYDRAFEMLGVWGKSKDNPAPTQFSHAAQPMIRGAKKLGIKYEMNPLAMSNNLCLRRGMCMSGCPGGAKLGDMSVRVIPESEATGNLEIRPQSYVLKFNLDDQGKVKSVTYMDESVDPPQEKEQEASVFILSAGTLQNPRLLLNSATKGHSNGLANGSGLVGANFMSHAIGVACADFEEDLQPYKSNQCPWMTDHFYGTNKKNDFLRGYVMIQVTMGPLMTFLFCGGRKDLLGKELKQHVLNYPNHGWIWVSGEDEPVATNRISLDPSAKDRYGMPIGHIHHEHTTNDLKIINAALKSATDLLEAGGGKHSYVSPIPDGSTHNMGTCRMGNDPNKSVVNKFNQTHEVENLFISDASTFVTSAAVNPSVTITALSLRAADHVLRYAKNGGGKLS